MPTALLRETLAGIVKFRNKSLVKAPPVVVVLGCIKSLKKREIKSSKKKIEP